LNYRQLLTAKRNGFWDVAERAVGIPAIHFQTQSVIQIHLVEPLRGDTSSLCILDSRDLKYLIMKSNRPTNAEQIRNILPSTYDYNTHEIINQSCIVSSMGDLSFPPYFSEKDKVCYWSTKTPDCNTDLPLSENRPFCPCTDKGMIFTNELVIID